MSSTPLLPSSFDDSVKFHNGSKHTSLLSRTIPDYSSAEVETGTTKKGTKEQINGRQQGYNEDDDDDSNSDDDDDDDDDNVMLPPLGSVSRVFSKEVRTRESKLPIYMDIFLMNSGSLMFISGSYLLYPEMVGRCGLRACKFFAALLFIVGSVFFLCGSVATLIHSKAYLCNDPTLTGIVVSYLIAGVLYVMGSCNFLPGVEAYIGNTNAGLIMFIVGSIIFIVSPIINIQRSFRMLQKDEMTRLKFVVETVVGVLYVLGSALFVIGCIFFFPWLYYDWSITLFLIGSVFFQLATFIPPVHRFYRYLNRRERKRAAWLRKIEVDGKRVYGAVVVS